MLRWLPGADEGTREAGERFVRRARELYTRLSGTLQRGCTIALTDIDGLEVAVVYHANATTADRIAGRLRKLGVATTSASDGDHAEVVLHKDEPAVVAIGISNIRGPCPACRRYFEATENGFAEVYWDGDTRIGPAG